MGSAPYPLSAASAAGSALGLAEDGKAQSHQTGADEQRQNGIGGHDVPDITDQRSQRTGVTKDGSNGGRSSFLKSTLLSKKMYGCGERGRTSITEFRARPVTVTAPRHVLFLCWGFSRCKKPQTPKYLLRGGELSVYVITPTVSRFAREAHCQGQPASPRPNNAACHCCVTALPRTP